MLKYRMYSGVEAQPHTFILAIDVNDQLHTLVASSPWTHWTRSWVSPSASLYAPEKRKSLSRAENRTPIPRSSSQLSVVISTGLSWLSVTRDTSKINPNGIIERCTRPTFQNSCYLHFFLVFYFQFPLLFLWQMEERCMLFTDSVGVFVLFDVKKGEVLT
jgi:hypothetical protein